GVAGHRVSWPLCRPARRQISLTCTAPLARPLVAAVRVTVDGARSVVARAGVTSIAIAAAIIAAIDRRPYKRSKLLDDAANLICAGGGRLCVSGRMRPCGDLVVGQARRGVRLQARK